MQLQVILSLFLGTVLTVMLFMLAVALWRRRSASWEIVMTSIKEAIVILNTHDCILDLNPAARQLVAGSPSHLLGRPFSEVFATWPQLVACCRRSQGVDEAVITCQGSDLRYFGLRITPLYRRNGHTTVTGRLVVLHDITGRVQAEKALKESERHFRNIFAEVPIGMAIVDLDGRALQVNKAFCEMLGYEEPELLGSSFSAITHPDDIGADTLLADKALAGEMGSYKVEKRYLKKNQETLWTDLTATILRNHRGEAIYGLVMLENIIERKRAKLLEEERYHVAYELHDGLAQVAVSVHQHLQALASHYHPRSPQARQELNTALELAQRSVREARRLIAGLRPTVLDDFGLAMALRLQIEAQRNDGWTILFEEALGPERLPRSIETTLFGVAQEALTNVHKHSRTTRTRLALKRQEANICLEVQDWGCGFEPRTLFKVYSPGEHVGIRTMQERVELLGGRFLVSSHPGFGTLVVAEVPLPPSNGKDHDETAPPVERGASPLRLRGYLNSETPCVPSDSAAFEVTPLLLRSYLTERDENNEP